MKTNANSKMVIVSVLGVLALWGSALADPNVPVGYYVEAYVTGFTHVSDIAFSPGGEFGYKNQLFVLDSRPNSKIYRIPEKGQKIFFSDIPSSNLLATSLDFAPPGSGFGPYLFAAYEYNIYKYASNGTKVKFADTTVFPWSIKFAPDERFRNNLFLADGWEPSGEAVREFNQNGTQSALVYTGREEICDLAFGPGGNFGEDLYVAFCYSERSGYPYSAIGHVTPEGVLTEWLAPEEFGYINRLAFDTTGNFRGNLFVADFLHDVIWEIDHNGNVNEFASGFSFSAFTEYAPMLSASIAFGPDGAMYVSDDVTGTVWRIAPIRGELDSLEIIGPDEVVENSSAQYTAKAHYTGGTIVNVTNSVQWSVGPNLYCEIRQTGKLTTADISMPTEDVIISAEYTVEGVTVQTEKDVTIFSICPNGYALKFDGHNDYLNVPDSPSLQLPSKLTAEAWVYPIYDGGDYYVDVILVKGQRAGWGDHFNYRIATENQNLYTWGVTRPGTELFIHGGTPIYNQWQHLALVADGASCKAYVNGTEVASRDAQEPYRTFPGYPLQIGGHGIRNTGWFSGLIDEVRIWNKALLQQEIKSNMNKKLTGNEIGLVAYWDFDQGQGQVVGDSAGDNHGQLGSTPNNDDNDPAWVESDAPVGICSFYLMAKQHIEVAESLKRKSLELLAKAIANEFLAQDIFSQMLETGEYENFKKGDIVKAKQKIHSAIQQEEQAETAVGQSIEKLGDALNALGIE